MSGPTSQDLWELFVEEASGAVARCLELLPSGGAGGAGAGPRDWSRAAGLLEAVEAQAALMGIPEVSSLARASKVFALAAAPR